MRWRGEYKVPGGKLVAVGIAEDRAGKVASCAIDGDFFVDTTDDADAQELLEGLGAALVSGSSLDDVFAAHPATRLVGTDAHALREAYRRAKAKADGAHGATHGASDAKRVSLSANFHGSNAGDMRCSGDRKDAGVGKRKILRQWHARWNSLGPEVVVDVPRSPAGQMRTDELWARQVADGSRPATLRFWHWSGPAVVIGRFQSAADEVDLDEAGREGFAVVRRSTGGGAMFVEPANVITFSLYVPAPFLADMSVTDSYAFLDMWLIDALRDMGLDVGRSGMNDIASPRGKIGGAAQRRYPSSGGGPGAVLHHVTLSYDIDASKMARVLRISEEKRSDKAVKSAVKSVDPLARQTGMTRETILASLVSSASRRYNMNRRLN